MAELVHRYAGYYPDPRDPDEVIAAVGLEEKQKTRPRKLSGGQRRRLDAALGVIGNPELLFLYEPTTGFDPEARRQFWTLIENLSGATLTEVLRRQAERFAAETGVDVQVSLDMPDEEVAALPQGQQVVLLRAAQEALANVRKHAGATQVRITFGISANGVGIEIRDDGLGFEPQAPASGFGLAAMRRRVEESGGTVQVDSAPGRGTRVQVLIPATDQEAS